MLTSGLESFAAAKEGQARGLARKLKVEVSPDIRAFFDAAKQGNWAEVLALRDELWKRASQHEGSPADPCVVTPVWQTVLELVLAAEWFVQGEPEYAFAFGRDIIASIPAGSIYFGGTDAGRGLVTALCRSHEQGDPFFTLTQNALADDSYLGYLREMYGAYLYVPTAGDCQQAFSDYVSDAQQRLKEGKLRPGEDVKIVAGLAQVSGQVAVMAINGLLTKLIFDNNPDREFFVEESWPLDWMYPHLTPHGLILKIHRQPQAAIPPEKVNQDREYWKKRVRSMLGDWLQSETSVGAVCDFAEKVFLRKDLSGFTGDPQFVCNEHTTRSYSKLRDSIGGIYAWRADEADEPDEKARMQQAAEYAFLQALALCPSSPEAVFRYVTLLVREKRHGDALLVAQTAAKLNPESSAFQSLVHQLPRLAKGEPRAH